MANAWDHVYIFNIPQSLVRKCKNDKKLTMSFKYPKSANGYAVMSAPAEYFEVTDNRFCKLTLPVDGRDYALSYKDEQGRWRSDWMKPYDIKRHFEEARIKKEENQRYDTGLDDEDDDGIEF